MTKKLCVVLIEADVFNKAVQRNIPKPLRNLCIKFDVNTLRQCGEMACVEDLILVLPILILVLPLHNTAIYIIAWASKLTNQVNFLIRAAVLYSRYSV